MKENWQTSFDKVMKSEGGFVLTNIPGDAGGLTYAGIARVPNPSWEGWAVIDEYLQHSEFKADGKPVTLPLPIAAILEPKVLSFYKAAIWDKVKGDDLPAGIDYLVFDFAVNAGPSQSAKTLQRAVGVVADGAIGPGTLAAVKAKDPKELVVEFGKQKEAFYHAIVERRPDNAKFIKGWLNRVAHVESIAHTMIT